MEIGIGGPLLEYPHNRPLEGRLHTKSPQLADTGVIGVPKVKDTTGSVSLGAKWVKNSQKPHCFKSARPWLSPL